MISKQDVLLLLALNDDDEGIMRVISSEDIPLDIIRSLNDLRPLDIIKFYEKIRASYNNHKSKLYINLVNDELDIDLIIPALNSYALLVVLFKDVDDIKSFYQHARLSEVYECLNEYINTLDIKPCIELLSYLRADLKLLESAYRENYVV